MSVENVSLEQLLHVIHTLYEGKNPAEKESASKWLIGFQKSLSAWKLADELLYHASDLNSAYFGAQTLRNKIQSQFTELPVESHLALKNSLLKHVQSITESTPFPITNQLLLAVTDMFLLMVIWKDAIAELANTLLTSQCNMLCLFTILKFIPEELRNSILRLGSNRKNQIMGDLEANRKLVIDLLNRSLATSNETVVCKIFECLASWWDHLDIMRDSDIQNSGLLEAAFCILKNPLNSSEQLYEAVTRWICALLIQCKYSNNSADQLLSYLQLNIYGLMEIVKQCSDIQQSNMTADQCSVMQDRLVSLAQIFCALARALKAHFIFTPTLNDGKLGDLRTMECLLSVMELPPPLGSFVLVTNLLDAFHSVIYSSSSHRFSNEKDALEAIKSMMPFFSRIVVGFTRHCSSSSVHSLSGESMDDLRDFRDEIYAIMQDLTPLVGAETIFCELNGFIDRSKALSTSSNAASKVMQEYESCLFMMSTVARHMSPHDPDQHIASLIQNLVLPGLGQRPPAAVQEVACFLFMELYDWAATHPILRREIVEQLISVIEAASQGQELNGDQREVVKTALVALSKLVQTNRPPAKSSSVEYGYGSSLLDDHWDALINRVIYRIPRLPWAPMKEINVLFEAIGQALMNSIGFYSSESEPTQSRASFPMRISQLFSVSLECLTRLMESNISCDAERSLSDPSVWLNYIAAGWRTFSSLLRRLSGKSGRLTRFNEQGLTEFDGANSPDEKMLLEATKYLLEHTILYAQKTMWPLISRTMTVYQAKDRVMENACRCTRFIVRALSTNLKNLLPEIAEKIVQVNSVCPHSCFLYLASILVDEFGSLLDCVEGLFNVFDVLIAPTLQILDGDGLYQNPNVVEDLFRLVTRMTQQCANQFLSRAATDICMLLDLATRSLDLPSFMMRDTVGSNGLVTGGNLEDNTKENDDQNRKDGEVALNQTVEYIQLIIQFTSEGAVDTPASIANTPNLSNLPVLSCPTELGARRVLCWLTRNTRFNTNGEEVPATGSQCGGLRLLHACLSTLFHNMSEPCLHDMASIVFSLKNMISHDMFIMWLNSAISVLPLKRVDGHELATQAQIGEFFSMIMSSSRVKEIQRALEWFSHLLT